MVTCITPTGDRPEVFELCRKWMKSQTKFPDQWIVIDDGKTPLPENLQEGVDYIRRNPSSNEGHTLLINLKTVIPFIKGNKILIIEDDDWYSPNYIKTMYDHLSKNNLVGECRARYYHAPSMRYKRINNTKHASLCQTGFTRLLLDLFVECLEGDSYVDMRFWGKADNQGYLFTDLDDNLHLHCSMKGLKGRRGIGSGHNEESRYYTPDNGLKNLVRWVGEDNARIYMDHVGQSFGSALLVGVPRTRGGAGTSVPYIPQVQSISVPINNVTVITCTGDRPESFSLLQKWMGKQSLKPDQWIVVDDGKEPLAIRGGFEYYRREPTPQDYTHTLCLNLLEALPKIYNDKVIIMEDDDWYAHNYIDYMSKLLDSAELVGMGRLIFYYPSLHKYMEKGTVKQPAFSQTAFRKELIPIIKEICESAPKEYDLCGKGLIDVFLWRHPLNLLHERQCVKLTTSLKISTGQVLPKDSIFEPPIPNGILRRAARNNGAVFMNKRITFAAKKMVVQCADYLTVGMKGMPGRKGLTTHHGEENRKYKPDPDYNLLKSILKLDADFYIKK